jgi:dolichol-phosphate mannosyltransferase
LVLLSTSIQTAFIGVLGEYIGRIFRNTRHIPSPIIDRRIEPLRTRETIAPRVEPNATTEQS